ncbi:MAG: cobalamin-binding protein [Candidatus Omnitrophica bacterium]|nr:cobalamin-binding protein [Candidatus Omnitrophota bacterium]
MRIVSLIASATEIICALGFQDNLVGRSHECDYPAGIENLPALSAPKIDVHGASAEIDRRVKDVVREGLSVYDVDADLLKALKPDVIVTQDQCEVCAVSLHDVEEAVAEWTGSRPVIVSLKPESMHDVWQDIRRVSDALRCRERAEALILEIQKEMEEISAECEGLVPPLNVACIEWVDPLMAAGNWVPEMVHLLHARCSFGAPGEHSKYITWEDIVKKDPNVIITMPCGFDVARTLQDIPILSGKPEWSDLKAVRHGRVYVTDGNQYFNRPGPRLRESLQMMAEMCYPGRFSFGFEGKGWQKLGD